MPQSIDDTVRAAVAYFPLIEDFDDELARDDEPARDDAPGETPDDEPFAEPAPDAAELAELRDGAYAQGRADERVALAAERSDAAALTLRALADALQDARHEAASVAEAAAEETARLLLRVLGTMMPALCARHGGADVAALVRAVVPALAHEPRVTIRVSPHVRAEVQAQLAAVAEEWGERIKLIATDAMAPGDVRIAWDSGTASRDVGELWNGVVAQLAPLGLYDDMKPPVFTKELENA